MPQERKKPGGAPSFVGKPWKSLAQMLVERFLDGFAGDVTHPLVEHLSILENQQSGNPAYAVALWCYGTGIHVHLRHFYFPLIGRGHFVYNRSQSLAGPAPCGPEINHDRLF